MKREHFVKVVEETLDSLPQEFRSRIRNIAILVEDVPPNHPSRRSGQQRQLLVGLFHGVPTTKKSMFDLPIGPDHIVLYQKNIEAVCSSEAEVREQIRRTVIHELGHYFGMDETQLKGFSWKGCRERREGHRANQYSSHMRGDPMSNAFANEDNNQCDCEMLS